MERLKKKALVLVLASVVTVVGSFASENYKNSVMSLKFESAGSDAVNMTILTKTPYSGNINPKKKDENTYVIMLPEINSKMEASPTLSGSITSVDVKTMPYTSSSNGYTKITIKTNSNIALNAKNDLYVPAAKPAESIADSQYNATKTQSNPEYKTQKASQQDVRYNQQENNYSSKNSSKPNSERLTKTSYNSSNNEQVKHSSNRMSSEIADNTAPNTSELKTVTPSKSNPNENNNDKLLLLGAIFVVVAIIIYLYLKTKRNLAEMLGDQSDLDFSDDKPVEKKTKPQTPAKQIRKTISNLDQMYKKPIKMPLNTDKNIGDSKDTNSSFAPDNNIVDLDELFQQKNNAENSTSDINDEKNDALEDFLKDFSFDEDETMEEEAFSEPSFNEELYNNYINNDKINFSKDDIDKINKLMNTEISDNAVKELSETSVVTQPIKKPSKQEILEDFMTTLAIKQDVTFTKDDVDALRKLISVELDNDFITDLRTNPERVKSMRKEIEERSVSASKKVNEILTLNVKDMLPDLSEALKKQGNRRIESEVKPEVVYFSEGYEYTTLSIKDELPDLTSEQNKKANSYRPSDDVEYAVAGYDAPKLVLDYDLPDLNKIKANPENYENKKSKTKKPNEKDLLKSIANVTFKPFYDGSENFEILNKLEDFSDIDEETVKKEISQFENFEIISDEISPLEPSENNNPLDELYDNHYYDLDQKTQEDEVTELDDTTDNNLLETISNERKSVVKENNVPNVETDRQDTTNTVKHPDMCVIEGESFEIVNIKSFTDKLGCYLAKGNDGYTILGYVGNNIFKIKHYEKLYSERLQTRVSETLPDGTIRYIVRIGIHKFILNVNKDEMEYVMDLC